MRPPRLAVGDGVARGAAVQSRRRCRMRRVVGWLVFVAFLVGLGALIHAGAGPTPRWRVHLPPGSRGGITRHFHLVDDDRALLTMAGDFEEGGPAQGPIRF